MNKKLLRKKLALMLANLKKKRKFFCEVEYLESTGTQYIDTGIPLTNEDTIKTKIRIIFETNSFFYGARKSYMVDAFGLHKTYAPFGSDSGMNYVYLYAGTDYIVEQSQNGIFINGELKKTYPISTFTTPENCYLFYLKQSGGFYDSPAFARIYYFQIYNGTTLVRDFIPVLDWDMTPCMYDKVSGQLFYNAGTGDFVVGREIHPVEYLESTGTQYINTGYKPNNTSGIYAKIQYTNTTSADYVAVGTWLSNNRFVAPFKGASNGSWFSGWGASEPSSGVTGDALDTDIHEIFLNYNNSRSISVDNTSLRTDISSISGNWKPIYLFARNLDGVLSGQMVGRIYNVQITEGTVLIRDFIPAIDENGVGFMFDRVTHTCFLNQGTGSFKYPAREIEYLESTGTQYIDTRYIPNQNTYVEMNAMYTALDSTYRTPFSVRAYDGAANSFTIAGATNAANVYAFGSSYWSGDNGCPVAYTNVKYFVSLKAGVAIFNGVTGNAGTTITPSSLTAYMFARNANGTASNFFKGRIYNCLVKEGTSVIRDFVPCFKDGVACMVDKANNVFYSNAGTGTFVCGKVIEKRFE